MDGWICMYVNKTMRDQIQKSSFGGSFGLRGRASQVIDDITKTQRIQEVVSLLVLRGAGSSQILAHWQQEECECDCCENCGERAEQSGAVSPRPLRFPSVSLTGRLTGFTGSIINSTEDAEERFHLPAVQMVKTTCTESKKKNMTSRDTEAPMGRNRACVESMV